MRLKKNRTSVKTGILLGIALLGLHTVSIAQQNFTYDISGTIPGAEKTYLSADMYGGKILDSAIHTNGKFAFKGKARSVHFGALIVKRKDKLFEDYYSLFIEPGKIKAGVTSGSTHVLFRGSKNNDIVAAAEGASRQFWAKVPAMVDSINFASMKMSDLHKAETVNKDSVAYYQAVYKRMNDASAPYYADRNKNLMAAFRNYPQSLFTAYYALNTGFLPQDTLERMYAKFTEKVKNSDIGKQWQEALSKAKGLQSGTPAPDFSTTDESGKTIRLSDYKGKYVLLDFWATWCVPCRAGNPHLIELYKKYNQQGIEFIGIADDDKNIAGWKKAIKNDGIDLWPQVLRGREGEDQKGESMDLSKKYRVDSYPTKILIDPAGNVVAVWIGDDELENVLSDVFSKK